MIAYPNIDEFFDRPHRAGCSVGETGTAGAWAVSGSNGENLVNAIGAPRHGTEPASRRKRPGCFSAARTYHECQSGREIIEDLLENAVCRTGAGCANHPGYFGRSDRCTQQPKRPSALGDFHDRVVRTGIGWAEYEFWPSWPTFPQLLSNTVQLLSIRRRTAYPSFMPDGPPSIAPFAKV
jgi:hypothetical protein